MATWREHRGQDRERRERRALVEAMPALRQLLAAYFHPDWRLDADDANQVVEAYLATATADQIAQARVELSRLLASTTDDEVLIDKVVALGMYDFPVPDDELRHWLRTLYAQLARDETSG